MCLTCRCRGHVCRGPGVQVVRKERAVGVLPQTSTIYEVLEELAYTVKNQLVR